MTKTIQQAVLWWCLAARHSYFVPNAFWKNFECDVLSLVSTGFTYEFEIKVSRADFLRDIKKKSDIVTGRNEYGQLLFENHNKFADAHFKNRTNYFYYVCPENLIKQEEIPERAGLIYYTQKHKWPQHNLTFIKKAKRIHNQKVTFDDLFYFLKKQTFKYSEHFLNKSLNND